MTLEIKRLTKKQKEQLIGEYFFSKGCPPLKEVARHFDVSNSFISKRLSKFMKERSKQ